ncbi:MAG: RNA polymerase factor sigma-54 [Gemmataceae bacterium]|nr:RNA polymerase factor sigma-54 [Gemmataceae bacterium]MDW8266539.1 RNA polymerase factor sigma-54 [Gemmataceae bacterium]
MRLETTMSQRLEQKMILAPRMIQSMEILQLPIMALQERIEQELQENPVLELQEDADEPADAESAADADLRRDTEPEPNSDESGDSEWDFDRLDALSKDWEDHFNEEHRPSRNGLEEEADKKHDAMQNMPSRPQSLHDYLNDQLSFLDLTPEQARLARFIIAHISDNGRLEVPLADIAKAYDQPVTVEEVEDALHYVQKLDPPGVGGRTLEECLLLQLTPEIPHADVVRVLIQHHLEDIQHNRLPAIQKKTGFELTVIKKALEALRRLNPWPGSGFATSNIPYVVPDIIVERTDDGDYTVRLTDDWVPHVHISRRYLEMYRDKSASPQDREYLKRKIQAAQWLLDSIEQRRHTLEKVTRAIIQHQRAFLDHGPEHIEPLKMQQIADQVGVHVTTVSRAVDDKWVQTPRGIFPLKRFFGGGTQTASGEEVAWETIKQKLLEIIDKEDKSNPLSDEDLVRKLSEAGYPVARRTVTKYRKMLKIPSSRQRKDWTLTSR